jgi:hypothetical protein
MNMGGPVKRPALQTRCYHRCDVDLFNEEFVLPRSGFVQERGHPRAAVFMT